MFKNANSSETHSLADKFIEKYRQWEKMFVCSKRYVFSQLTGWLV